MKKSGSILLCFVFLILASGCSDLITNSTDFDQNDELTLKSKKHPVSFNGEFSVWVNVPPAPVDGILYQTEYGTSNQPHPEHLGVTKLYNEEIIYMSANTGLVPWDEVDPWIAVANITLTAANGDELSIEINYEIDPGQFPLLIAAGSGNITEGTGRFIDATGTLDFNAVFNVAELKGTHFFNGEITY